MFTLPIKRRLWLAIAGSFFVIVFNASADVVQVLPEMEIVAQGGAFSAEGSIEDNRFFSTNESFEFENGLNQEVSSSNFGVAEETTSDSSRILLERHQSRTITGAPGETVVLNFRRFVLRNHSTFTLQGAASTTFIINVAKQFSLAGNSRIVLSGGVQWNSVFFNILGPGEAPSLRKNASLQGTLTASQRTVRLRGHSIITGQVVANNLRLLGMSQIITPPIVSP
jgi:Ice-binding-like